MRNLQTELFPDMRQRTAAPVHPKEARLMDDLMEAAGRLGLFPVHIQTFHENSFWVTCERCGNRTLATCRKPVNAEYAGWPDIIIPIAGIEVKRTRNLCGDGFEPSDVQVDIHDRLRAAGVPVIVVSPGNITEAEKFLLSLTRKETARKDDRR